MRNAVAEIFQRQPLEHDIGQPAIGRCIAGALFGDDQRIRLLIFATAIDAARQTVEIERFAVGPDSEHGADLAVAKADREIAEIGIGGCRDGIAAETALAAGILGAARDLLLKFGRPDHFAGKPRPAIDPRNRRALGRGHHVEIGKPRPAHHLVATAKQRVVDDVADCGTQQAAGNRTNRTGDRVAHGRAGHRQKK